MLSRLGRTVRLVKPPVARWQTTTANEGFLAKYGLDDWKLQVPFGIFLAIPIIHNEVIILSEETQLVGCFALFCGALYKVANESVADMLDARGKQILAQHNAVEEQAITASKEIKGAHEAQIKMLSEVSTLISARQTAEIELAEAKACELKHYTRDSVVKMLDTLVAKQDQVDAVMTQKLIADAVEAVTAEFQSDQVKEALLTEAIAVMSSPDTKQATIVPQMFNQFFANTITEANKNTGKEIDLSPEMIAEIKDEIDALKKRDGIDVDIDIPTKMTL